MFAEKRLSYTREVRAETPGTPLIRACHCPVNTSREQATNNRWQDRFISRRVRRRYDDTVSYGNGREGRGPALTVRPRVKLLVSRWLNEVSRCGIPLVHRMKKRKQSRTVTRRQAHEAIKTRAFDR